MKSIFERPRHYLLLSYKMLDDHISHTVSVRIPIFVQSMYSAKYDLVK